MLWISFHSTRSIQEIPVNEVRKAQEIPVDGVGDYSALTQKILYPPILSQIMFHRVCQTPIDAAKEAVVSRRSRRIRPSLICISRDRKYIKEENVVIYLFTPNLWCIMVYFTLLKRFCVCYTNQRIIYVE